MTVREQIAARLGVTEETTVGDPVFEELQQRLQGIAPEVRAGEPDALAEQARIEDEIAAEMKRRELDELAEAELAARARAAAVAERESRRGELSKRQGELDAQRDERLWLIESAIDELLYAIVQWSQIEIEAEGVGHRLRTMEHEDLGIDDPRPPSGNWRRTVENRLSFRLREIAMHELDFPLGVREIDGKFVRDGGLPLGKEPVTKCAICAHEQADEITAAINAREETGESLRAISERFRVGRTTLRRHAAHVTGPLVVEE